MKPKSEMSDEEIENAIYYKVEVYTIDEMYVTYTKVETIETNEHYLVLNFENGSSICYNHNQVAKYIVM